MCHCGYRTLFTVGIRLRSYNNGSEIRQEIDFMITPQFSHTYYHVGQGVINVRFAITYPFFDIFAYKGDASLTLSNVHDEYVDFYWGYDVLFDNLFYSQDGYLNAIFGGFQYFMINGNRHNVYAHSYTGYKDVDILPKIVIGEGNMIDGYATNRGCTMYPSIDGTYYDMETDFHGVVNLETYIESGHPAFYIPECLSDRYFLKNLEKYLSEEDKHWIVYLVDDIIEKSIEFSDNPISLYRDGIEVDLF